VNNADKFSVAVHFWKLVSIYGFIPGSVEQCVIPICEKIFDGLALKGMLTAAAVKFADTAEELDLMSKRTGVSASALSELAYAAKQSGQDIETLEGSLKKMQKTIGAAFEGNGEAITNLARLGITLDKVRGKSPDQQFELIGDAIAKVGDPTMRAAIAMQIFGRSGTALLPMMGNIKALRKEAEDLDLVMSDSDVTLGSVLASSLKTLRDVVVSVVNAIGASLAPALINFVNAATRIGVSVHKWVDAHRDLIETFAKVVSGVVAAAAGTAALGTALGVVLNPIVMISAAIGGAAFAFVKFTQAGRNAWASISNTLNGIQKLASYTFGGIADALMAGDLELAAKITFAGIKIAFEEVTNFLQLKLLEIKKFWFETWSGMTALLGGVISAVKATANAIGNALKGAVQMPVFLEQAQHNHEEFQKQLASIKQVQAARAELKKKMDAGTATTKDYFQDTDLQAQEEAMKKRLRELNAEGNRINDNVQGAAGNMNIDVMGEFRKGFQQGALTDPDTEKKIADLKAQIAAHAGAGDSPEVAAAKAQLDALRKQAGAAAAKAKADDDARREAHQDKMANASDGLAGSQQKVWGAFGIGAAIALGGAGGASPQQKLAQHAANTAQNTANMAKLLADQGKRIKNIEGILGTGLVTS
jgi:hypothetical protein